MNLLPSFLRYALLILLSGLVVFVFQSQLMNLYKYAFPNETGGGFDINFTGIVVLFYSIEFLLPLLIVALGDRSRYWVAGVLAGSLGIFELFADQFNFKIPLLLIASGLVFGFLIRLIATNTLGKMPSLSL